MTLTLTELPSLKLWQAAARSEEHGCITYVSAEGSTPEEAIARLFDKHE